MVISWTEFLTTDYTDWGGDVGANPSVSQPALPSSVGYQVGTKYDRRADLKIGPYEFPPLDGGG